ncbi:MAG: MotA/TolQ/ExbB proton channel family protein [Gemmatimonadales bacterium]
MLLTLQTENLVPSSTWQLLETSGPETLVILGVTLFFSLLSWFVIGVKAWQFRRIRRQAGRFFQAVEGTSKLQDAYKVVMKLPNSAYNRLFREGMTFYNELQPGVVRDGPAEGRISFSPTQLDAFKMVLGKEVAEERDHVSRFVPWLATIGSVSPLIGLLGTVLGVMNAFIGISAQGSGNISAVAPGVAQALITTVAGLFAAIPAVMSYNYFAAKTAQFEGELEGLANSLIGWMAREGWL